MRLCRVLANRVTYGKENQGIHFHDHCQAYLIHYFGQEQVPLLTHVIQCRIQVIPRYFINQVRPAWPAQNVTQLIRITRMTLAGLNPGRHIKYHNLITVTQWFASCENACAVIITAETNTQVSNYTSIWIAREYLDIEWTILIGLQIFSNHVNYILCISSQSTFILKWLVQTIRIFAPFTIQIIQTQNFIFVSALIIILGKLSFYYPIHKIFPSQN